MVTRVRWEIVAFLERLPDPSEDEYRQMVIAAGLEFFSSIGHGGGHTHAEPGNEGTPDHGGERHTHPPSESEPTLTKATAIINTDQQSGKQKKRLEI